MTSSNPPQKPQTCPVYGPEHQYTVVVGWEYDGTTLTPPILGRHGITYVPRIKKATKVMCACTAVKGIV